MKYSLKNKNAKNARQALQRNNVRNSGKVATLLFETFIENRGKLKASEVYEKNLCDNGKFYEWRQELCDKGWLIFEIEPLRKFAKYFPGKKLLKYINEEKNQQYEIATTKDLMDLENHVEKRLKEQEKDILERVVELFNPPVNQEKKEDLKTKLKLIK